MAEPILELDEVHTFIGQHHILQGVSLRIRPDAVTVLLGRNGAGKTTTMRTIVGLLHPSRGTVRFEGREIHRLPPYEIVRLGVGYVPEGQGVFARLAVDADLRGARLAVGAGGRGLSAALTGDETRRVAPLSDGPASRERLEQIFALFPDIERFRRAPAGTLSGGQKQMLSIARAFVNPNRLLLIDEPSKGLAPIIVEHLVEALRTMKEHATVLLVEQNFAMARALGDWFYLIDDGRTVHSGPMEALVDDAALKKRYLGI